MSAALCLCLQGQEAPTKEAPSEAKGLPPRATPADYQAQAQAGAVTIAAEFKGHSIPTPQGPLTHEAYVAVEMGLFGAAGARVTVSVDDFTLRINGRKAPLPAQPFGLVLADLKDPEWEPPVPVEKKSKTSMGGQGGQGEADPPPAAVKIPVPVLRAMAQRVQKASLPEGDRALPVAGVIYFQYRGKSEKIRSVELTYAGPAGKATLSLQP